MDGAYERSKRSGYVHLVHTLKSEAKRGQGDGRAARKHEQSILRADGVFALWGA